MPERERSFWGWGYVADHLDEERIWELADRLEADFDFPTRTLADPPALETVHAPEPKIPPPPLDCCTGSEDARIRHTYGDAYPDKIRAFAGEFDAAPDVVAIPEDETDIEAILDWAADERIAVIPYGGGTSVVGGVEATVPDRYNGVVSVDLRKLNAVRDVDETSRTALIEGGTLGPEIQAQLDEYDFQLRHYPQSYEFSTLGGWLATHSGGHFATRYTHIDDFCEAVRMVAPAGTLETEPVPASGAGPDPNQFILGSEGALGFITRAWMRVQPRPSSRTRATVRFDQFEQAVAATRAIAQARLAPANCRLLDTNEVRIYDVADDPGPFVFLGFESLDGSTMNAMETAIGLCEDHGGRCPRGPIAGDREAKEDTPEARWRRAFLAAPYWWDAFVRLGVVFDTFETATTWDKFPRLDDAIREQVGRAIDDACGMGWLSCRFTHVYPDGPAPYYTFIAPAERGREREQWRHIKETAADVLAEQEATITHHHAVGRVHQDWYARETRDFQAALRAVKRVVDPAGIMNPGVLLD